MNPYDAVRYPTLARSDTHPDRLGAVATLCGMQPADPGRCRVLELGCGTGGNLLPMAYGLPASEFVGVDLAETSIAKARRRAAELELRNVSLHAMDLADVGDSFGAFDYIIAHGVYSWVPAGVREALMAVCSARLAAQGVAYVSYNAYPGCHLRRMLREILLYHTLGVEEPQARVEQARAFASLMLQAQTETALRCEIEAFLERAPAVIYHDDLAPVNEPVYFHQFVAHAREHGMEFLSEASLVAAEGSLPDPVRAALAPLDADPPRKEQYLDFARLRRFRQTLLCRAGLELARGFDAAAVRRLYASSKARAAGPPGPDGAVEFRGDSGASAKTAHPLVKAALACLGGFWPHRAAFSDLLALVRADAGSTAPEELDAAALAEILWHSARSGLVELHAHPGRFAVEPGERPLASAVARLDLTEGNVAATLAHGIVQVEDDMARRLVLLLDGTRDRAALAGELGVPAEAIDASLEGVGRLALLVVDACAGQPPHPAPSPPCVPRSSLS